MKFDCEALKSARQASMNTFGKVAPAPGTVWFADAAGAPTASAADATAALAMIARVRRTSLSFMSDAVGQQLERMGACWRAMGLGVTFAGRFGERPGAFFGVR